MLHPVILKYFPDLSLTQQQQFQQLGPLYQEWNLKINVISRKDIEELYLKHVLHSLGIAKVTSFPAGAQVLDVGTGGGFPGIPLAILFPDTHFHLVDSIGKKIKVVQNVAASLGLKNVKAEQIRAEQLSGHYDFVVSRAVVKMGIFYGWVKNKIRQNNPEWLEGTAPEPILKNGILSLKGGDLKEELAEVKTKQKVFNLSVFFEEDFFETKQVVYLPVLGAKGAQV